MSDKIIRCPQCGAPMTQRFAERGPHAGKVFLGCTRFPACKGNLSADGTDPTADRRSTRKTRTSSSPQTKGRTPLNVGDLIVSSENDLGVGKAVSRQGDQVILEYFDNPGQAPEERVRRAVSVRSMRRFNLDQEVRAFWQTELGWRSGRLDEINENRDILVRTRDGARFLRERDVYIRWDRPLHDPVGFGEAGLMESPYLSDLRRPFMHHVLRQRAASHGMGAALASSIELHPHQLDAARRVLEDPIQRYLLADEVGLGKTIEAGIVIRQILQDYPASTVQLILPPFLVEQWGRELDSKFGIRDFSADRIRIAREDRPDEWTPADLLVVDEAHNLARMRTSTVLDLRRRYEKLSEVALASPRLLLLSATPVLHNEEVFLGMLQLLDPALYGQATVESVRQKVESRSKLGRTFMALKPSLPASVLNRLLGEVRKVLADDEQVQTLVDAVQAAVAERDKSTVTAAINELHAHVSEVHRVHRRMIRTRRTEGLLSEYRVQGRMEPKSFSLDSVQLKTASDLLDEWRQYAVASTEIGQMTVEEGGRLFAEACALLLDPQALADWARHRRQDAASDDENDVLERIEYTLRSDARRAIVSAPLADHLSYQIVTGERVVIFCSTTALAEELAQELGDLLGDHMVVLHLSSMDPTDAEYSIRIFESDSPDARILVCDKSAEEGRNLQMADVVVHVGLPSEVNRLEQRIGRTDRWTGTREMQGVRCLRVASADDTDQWDVLWSEIVQHGFEVFTKSVASLQHAVEMLTAEAWEALFLEGADAKERVIRNVTDKLAAELDHVREQDSLDSREAPIDSRSIFAQMSRSELEENSFAEIADDLFARDGASGNIRLTPTGSPRTGRGSYRITKERSAEPPLIPLWRLRRDFVPVEGQVGTFRREIAVANPGVRLYRYGSPFIDAVSDFVWNDDRGRAFGMWRYDPEWKYEELVAYRFDFHIEADLPEPNSLSFLAVADESHAIRRRADSLFPPTIETVWIDATGNVISDPATLSILSERYRKPRTQGEAGDFSINITRLQRVFQIVPRSVWRDEWRAAESAARSAVLELERVQDRISTGSSLCEHDHQTRIRQLALREQYASAEEAATLASERRVESDLSHTLSAAIANPSLRLDSTGIVIVSGYSIEDLNE
ncbi:protein DpdE [Rhodococcus zopfii]|uniref:protein DpdE n=1 Tax=Rhodococcus zopfii TaxID=43772 RepID=UPI00365B99D8